MSPLVQIVGALRRVRPRAGRRPKPHRALVHRPQSRRRLRPRRRRISRAAVGLPAPRGRLGA